MGRDSTWKRSQETSRRAGRITVILILNSQIFIHSHFSSSYCKSSHPSGTFFYCSRQSPSGSESSTHSSSSNSQHRQKKKSGVRIPKTTPPVVVSVVKKKIVEKYVSLFSLL